MSADLPIIPCYKDNNCVSNFNCGNLCNNEQPSIDNMCNDNPNLFKGSCWGSNSEYCEGILSICDPTDTSINCSELNTDYRITGAKNSNNDYIGCNINNTTFPPNINDIYNNYISPCMEFNNSIDSEADIGNICWSSGGYDIIKNLCETKIGHDKYRCKAMSYFCEWDEANNICTLPIERVNISPRKNFSNKYIGSGDPPPILTIAIKNDCSNFNNNTNSDTRCIEIDDPNYIDNSLYVTSSQSSWNSQLQTSYNPDQRIECVRDMNNPDNKICITTPRCQIVDNPCECGSIETNYYSKCSNYYENNLDDNNCIPNSSLETEQLQFMCTPIDINNVSINDIFGEVTNISAYVTWCKGIQSDKEYNVPKVRSQELIDLDIGIIPTKRDPVDWYIDNNGNCNNRCSNYNECESNDSEELWNKCIYDKSNGKYGVDYNTIEYKNNKDILLREQGFCIDKSSSDYDDMKIYLDLCEEELEYLGSINWGRVFSPSEFETAACQYRYNWQHRCSIGADNTHISQNYLCTWCPSLQCKIGTRNDICSEIVEDDNSWNNLPYCNTDSKHGSLVREGLPTDCDCFLPKTKSYIPGGIYPYKDREYNEYMLTILIGSILCILISIIFIYIFI